MKKRKQISLVLLLCSLLLSLAGCGGRKEENPGQSGSVEQSGSAGQNSASKDNAGQKEKGDAEEYYDIVTYTEEFFDVLSLDWGQVLETEERSIMTTFLGMQFYQEEPVQL